MKEITTVGVGVAKSVFTCKVSTRRGARYCAGQCGGRKCWSWWLCACYANVIAG